MRGSAPASKQPFEGRWTDPGVPAMTSGVRSLPGQPDSDGALMEVDPLPSGCPPEVDPPLWALHHCQAGPPPWAPCHCPFLSATSLKVAAPSSLQERQTSCLSHLETNCHWLCPLSDWGPGCRIPMFIGLSGHGNRILSATCWPKHGSWDFWPMAISVRQLQECTKRVREGCSQAPCRCLE